MLFEFDLLFVVLIQVLINFNQRIFNPVLFFLQLFNLIVAILNLLLVGLQDGLLLGCELVHARHAFR